MAQEGRAQLRLTSRLRLFAAALVTVLVATVVGCQGEPEVVYVDREVIREVPVEKVVIREVVVTATPAPTPTPIPGPTATPVPTSTPPPPPETIAISAGEEHTCALRDNGDVVCWGSNEHGQTSAPGGPFVAISAGLWHTCGLRESDAAVVCWGNNIDGQASAPGGRFIAISAGMWHTCGLRESDAVVVCWGSNEFGMRNVIGGRFIAISAQSKGHICGLRENGAAVCWGWNREGQASAPGGRFVAISAGGEHTCALSANGTGACWGLGARDGTPFDGPFVAISAGGEHTCALNEDGTATCWGRGNHGESSPPPGRFKEIAAGGSHSCGLREEGGVVCWGNNRYGQSSPPDDLARLNTTQPRSASRIGESPGSFDAASMLARFSVQDPRKGEERADAVAEIISRYQSGEVEQSRVADLLHTIAPELSIEERRQAADELASISEDGQWDENDTANGIFHLATLITGDDPNAGERIEAAHEIVVLYEIGELDPDHSLGLLDTIAPGLAINQRRQAAAALARLAADQDWDDADRMAAASEVFRLVTGVPLDAEARMGAAVDLAGVSVKILDDDSFDDREIDMATTLIKQSLTGELTSEGLQSILASGN